MRRAAEVKTDSTATIKFTGLMGQNFVAIDFGTPRGELLKDDDDIGTAEQADLSAMMQKLDNVADGVENVTKSFTGFKIDTLVGPLRDFITPIKRRSPRRSPTCRRSPSTCRRRCRRAKAPWGNSSKTRRSTTPPSRRSATCRTRPLEIKSTVADARKVVDQVNSGQGTVGKLVKDEQALPRDHRVHDQPEGNSAEDESGPGHGRQADQRSGVLQERQAELAEAGQGDRGPGGPGTVERPGPGRGHFVLSRLYTPRAAA